MVVMTLVIGCYHHFQPGSHHCCGDGYGSFDGKWDDNDSSDDYVDIDIALC